MPLQKKPTAPAKARVSRIYEPSEATMTEGGFLDGRTAEIIDAEYKLHTFEAKGEEGQKGYQPERIVTNAHLTFEVEGIDKPIDRDYGCGQGCEPSEDGVDGAEVGMFVVPRVDSRFKGFHKKSAFGKFLTEGNKIHDGFDAYTTSKYGGVIGLVGTKGVLKEIPGEEYKDRVTGQMKTGREIAVFESFEQVGQGEQAKAPAKKQVAGKVAAAAEQARFDKKFPKTAARVEEEAAEEAEEEAPEQEQEGSDDAVAEAIAGIAAKGQISKLRLSQAVGTLFSKEDPQARKEATRLALQDDYLKQGAEAGWWSYDGKLIGPAA